MKRAAASVLILMMLICGFARAEGELNVVATSFPCYDFARQVVGDRGEVTLLIRPGVEVHAYEPSPADIHAIGQADLFVYIGGEGDAWAERIIGGFEGEGGPVALKLMDSVIPLEEEASHGHGEPEYDEHIWTSPKNAAAMVEALAEGLCGVDPENAEAYRACASDYTHRILELDRQFRQVVEDGVRRTVVFADRFPFLYFVREYGLDYVAAFPSCSAETEPTPRTMMHLIETVVAQHIPVIYTIEMSSQSVARTISEETGAKILTFHSAQTVTQEEYDSGASYVSLMEGNLEALREGLGR